MLGIENVEIITKRVEFIDGENVFFIDPNMKEEIQNAREFIDANNGDCLIEHLSYDINFMLVHVGFAVIFRPVFLGEKEIWVPCLVYYYKDAWQKVAIQHVFCKECGWKGRIACPTDADVFDGMQNRFERMKKAFELQFLGCPECGGKLSSNAIWIDT